MAIGAATGVEAEEGRGVIVAGVGVGAEAGAALACIGTGEF